MPSLLTLIREAVQTRNGFAVLPGLHAFRRPPLSRLRTPFEPYASLTGVAGAVRGRAYGLRRQRHAAHGDAIACGLCLREGAERVRCAAAADPLPAHYE